MSNLWKQIFIEYSVKHCQPMTCQNMKSCDHSEDMMVPLNPVFFFFDSNGSLFYASMRSDWPLRSAEKSGMSLSHLVAEIFWPTFGRIFIKIFYLTVFHSDFRSSWPTSTLFLDPFDPSFLENFRFEWVHFYRVLNPQNNNLVKKGPPPLHGHYWT